MRDQVVHGEDSSPPLSSPRGRTASEGAFASPLSVRPCVPVLW
jgi:hypothetical protein